MTLYTQYILTCMYTSFDICTCTIMTLCTQYILTCMYVHLIDPVYKGHFVYVLVFEIISCQPGVRSSLQKRLAVEFKFEGRTILFASVCNKQRYYYNIDVSTLPAIHCYQWMNLQLWLICYRQENINPWFFKMIS